MLDVTRYHINNNTHMYEKLTISIYIIMKNQTYHCDVGCHVLSYQ